MNDKLTNNNVHICKSCPEIILYSSHNKNK